MADVGKLLSRLSKDAPAGKYDDGVSLLSLFDGIGGARVAMDRAGIPVSRYYSSEINPSASAVVRENYPDVIELGDVRGVQAPPDVDLLCAGFPCQDMSRANMGRGKGLAGERSGLFWEIPRILDEAQPRLGFIVENVVPRGSVDHKDVDVISRALGVDPVRLNASDFSGMERDRLFWTNLDVPLYGGSQARMSDFLDESVDPRWYYSERAVAGMNRPAADGRTPFQRHGQSFDRPKARTVTASYWKGQPHNALLDADGRYRQLTPSEVERLFGFPEGYTSSVPTKQRFMGLGNSWSVPTVQHILGGLVP